MHTLLSSKGLNKFRNNRDWEQFHNAKELVLALNVESFELYEVFPIPFFLQIINNEQKN
jgi:hypothetical protein